MQANCASSGTGITVKESDEKSDINGLLVPQPTISAISFQIFELLGPVRGVFAETLRIHQTTATILRDSKLTFQIVR
jgi:hypothetical protein